MQNNYPTTPLFSLEAVFSLSYIITTTTIQSAATSTAGPAVDLANLEYATPATKRHGGGVSSSPTTTTVTGTTGDTATSSLTTGAAAATTAATAVVPSTTMTMTTVTPQDDGKGTNSSGANNKQVRFGAEEEGENLSPSSTEKSLPDITAAAEDASNRTSSNKSKRGLVSKRGRYVSPGRRVSSSSSSAPTSTSSSSFHHDESVSAAAATVAEFKNFRSPLRAQQQEGVGPTTTTTTEKSSASSASNPGIPARSISADPSIADIAASPVKSSTTTAAAAAVAASDNAEVAVASAQQSDKVKY